MSYGELTLPPVWTGINKQNGQFLKGHVPANKGKKWSDYMGKRAMKRAAKEIGKIDDLQAVIDKAFDIAKVKAAEKRLEDFKRITKRDYGKDV